MRGCKFWVIGFALMILSGGCAPTEKVNLIVNSKDNPVIIPPNCPDWSYGGHVNYSNTASTNYGCATTTNFGAMIEDPNDMISGKTTGLTNAARSALPVSTYETGGGGGGAAAASTGQ